MTPGEPGFSQLGHQSNVEVAETDRPDVVGIAVVDDLPRKRLFSLDFVDSADMTMVADSILSRAEPERDAQLPVVVTPNVDIVVQMNQRPDSIEAGVLMGAQYCLPDGQPIVTASRLLGQPLSTRLAGRLLFAEIWPRLVEAAVPVAVLASSDEVKAGLLAEHPGAQVHVAPLFSAAETQTIDRLAASIVDDAQQSGAQYVLSGVGFPKDLLIADSIIRQWPSANDRCPTVMGLGASFAFHLGISDISPEWMQRLGLEWFHRFLQEPRRLFHRYFVRDVQFVPLVLDEWRATREQRGVTVNG